MFGGPDRKLFIGERAEVNFHLATKREADVFQDIVSRNVTITEYSAGMDKTPVDQFGRVDKRAVRVKKIIGIIFHCVRIYLLGIWLCEKIKQGRKEKTRNPFQAGEIHEPFYAAAYRAVLHDVSL
jgi:hypothetical protein